MPFFGQSDGSLERNRTYHRRTARPPTLAASNANTAATSDPCAHDSDSQHSKEEITFQQMLQENPHPPEPTSSTVTIHNMGIVDAIASTDRLIPAIAEPVHVDKESDCNICTPMQGVPHVLKLCRKHANLGRSSSATPKLTDGVNTLRRTPAVRRLLHLLNAATKEDAATLTAYTKETYTRTIHSLRKISSGESLRSLKKGGLRKVASVTSLFKKDKEQDPMRGFRPVPVPQTLWNEPIPARPEIDPGVVRRSSRNPDGAEEVRERLAGRTMRMVPSTVKGRK